MLWDHRVPWVERAADNLWMVWCTTAQLVIEDSSLKVVPFNLVAQSCFPLAIESVFQLELCGEQMWCSELACDQPLYSIALLEVTSRLCPFHIIIYVSSCWTCSCHDGWSFLHVDKELAGLSDEGWTTMLQSFEGGFATSKSVCKSSSLNLNH